MKIEKEEISIVEFEKTHRGLTNSELFEKIYGENEVGSKLKKSDQLYVYELMDTTTGKPMFTFVFNKGFMRGKTFCVLLTHKHEDKQWHTQISEPFIKDGETWTEGKFRTKGRDEEFTSILESGIIWE